jgi:hypothetical protein
MFARWSKTTAALTIALGVVLGDVPGDVVNVRG